MNNNNDIKNYTNINPTQSIIHKETFRKPLFPKRQDLYLDMDDVIINTSETIVTLIDRFYPHPDGNPRTLSSLRDWGYRSINPNITREQVDSLFASTEFWDLVNLNEGFLPLLKSKALSKYNVHITTHCTSYTKQKKIDFLTPIFSAYVPHYDFIFIPLDTPKSTIDMSNGVQVDDNLNNLTSTNALFKILLTNNLQTTYNGTLNDHTANISNLYICNTVPQLQEILQFNSKVGGLY